MAPKGRDWEFHSIEAVDASTSVLDFAHRWCKSHRFEPSVVKWLVETEIAFSVEEQHFIGTTAGQIHFKSACAFSKKFSHNLEYLAALWSDLDEKLSSWS